MPANHQASTVAGVTSSLKLAAEVSGQCEAGEKVVSENPRITVGGKNRNQALLVQRGADPQQQALIEVFQKENNRLLASVAILLKELRFADQEARKTAVMLRSVAAEVREVMEPYREMYKDERLCKAKADAKRQGVPELVVDTIVSQFLGGNKFPTIGTLMKRLLVTGSLNKLKAGGHGASRARVAHWLKTVRTLMVQRGFVEKYRVRFVDLPVHPDDQIHHPASGEENLPEESADGMTKRDTRDQELGSGFSDPSD